jgi:DNA-binding MarR family transcriptional regulator
MNGDTLSRAARSRFAVPRLANLPTDITRRVAPTAQQSVQLITFRLAEFHAILYVHPSLLQRRDTDESQMSQIVDERAPAAGPRFTQLQGQYLAFIYAYSRIFKRAPAEADMRRHFEVTAPSVHQMVMTLEKAGLIKREPGAARSIQLLVPPENLPILR